MGSPMRTHSVHTSDKSNILTTKSKQQQKDKANLFSMQAYNTWIPSSLQHLGPLKLTTPWSLHAYNTWVPSSLQHLGPFKLTTPGSLHAYNTWVPSSLQHLGPFKLTTPGSLQAYNTWVPSRVTFLKATKYVFEFDIILTDKQQQ